MFIRLKFTLALLVLMAVGFSATRCAVSPDSLVQGEGTLRVLITDKPYPLDRIEEANITITRVDVRRADALPVCDTDADCADDVFCNGTETCVEGDCVNGDFPCAAGEFCDEELEACMSPCEDDAQCNDPFYCNGTETCDLATGECQEGLSPCTEEEVCDEATDSCVADDGDDDDDDDDDSTWITIFEGTRPFNLLELQHGQTDLLAETTIAAGTYTQMRLVVTQGEVKLNDVAEPFVLQVPSGERTGIKLHFTFEVAANEETVLLLDVDLTRAFRPIPAGQIDDPMTIRTFHFTPSVAMRLISFVEAGTITGVVVDEFATPLENVIVTVHREGNGQVAFDGTDQNGMFTLMGLPIGSYRLELTLSGFEDVEVPDVGVSEGETTDVGTITMTAVAP